VDTCADTDVTPICLGEDDVLSGTGVLKLDKLDDTVVLTPAVDTVTGDLTATGDALTGDLNSGDTLAVTVALDSLADPEDTRDGIVVLAGEDNATAEPLTFGVDTGVRKSGVGVFTLVVGVMPGDLNNGDELAEADGLGCLNDPEETEVVETPGVLILAVDTILGDLEIDNEVVPIAGLVCRAVPKRTDVAVFGVPTEVDAKDVLTLPVTGDLIKPDGVVVLIGFVCLADHEVGVAGANPVLTVEIPPLTGVTVGDVVLNRGAGLVAAAEIGRAHV